MASAASGNHGTIRFGEGFELDRRAYQLRRSGRVLRVERIPMELLLLLVDQRGDLVSRSEIVEKIWGKDVFLDTDNSINSAIRKLRRALRDDPDRPRFILTIPGKGYRFIAPIVAGGPEGKPATENHVESVPAPIADVQGPAQGQGPATVPRPEPVRTPARKGRPIAVALGLLLVAAFGAWLVWSRAAARRPLSGGKMMLAVLPFENLTGDPAQEYFSDGLTEEMISRLGGLDPQHLGVIARTSVTPYKRSQTPLAEIARALGVQYVLEGSVRRDAGRVRIAVQLIQVSDQTHLWARQYERELSSLLAVQEEIAQAVARQIRVTLADRERGTLRASPLSPEAYEAYDLYLKGRYFWNKRTPEGFQQAVDHFRRATERDPACARAYAGLADSYALMSSYSQGPPGELVPKARAAALRALELDERLAEAHTSLALIQENYDWDWRSAEKSFRRAIELDPNYATAHHWYAEFLSFQGRFDEALTESERARRIDPLSLIIAVDRGAILYYARRYDDAIEQFRAVMAVDPDYPRANIIIAAYLAKGMFQEALSEVERWRSHDDSPSAFLAEVYLYGRWGRLAEARKAFEKFKEANRASQIQPAPALAGAYIALGDKEQAIHWLNQAYLEHSNAMTTLKVDPGCDLLRDDPRFQDLLRRVGLDRQASDG